MRRRADCGARSVEDGTDVGMDAGAPRAIYVGDPAETENGHMADLVCRWGLWFADNFIVAFMIQPGKFRLFDYSRSLIFDCDSAPIRL
jgi:hypothetical protein